MNAVYRFCSLQKLAVLLLATVLLLFTATSCSESTSKSTVKSTSTLDNQNAETPSEPKESQSADTRSPEETIKAFMIAMVSSDLNSLKSVSLEHEDLHLLVENHANPNQVEQSKRQLTNMPLRRMKIGETFVIPGPSKTEVTIHDKFVNEKRMFISSPGHPLPFDVAKTESGWRVNPDNFIILRKSANKIRQRQNK